MKTEQLKMIQALRFHVHDAIRGRAPGRETWAAVPRMTRGGGGMAARIDDIEAQIDVGPGGEEMLTRQAEDELMDYAMLLRGLAGETKVSLGYVLQDQRMHLKVDEFRRLKDALDWLKLAEISFRSIPAQIELVRERRAESGVARERHLRHGQQVPTRGVPGVTLRTGVSLAELLPSSPGMAELQSQYVLNDEDNQPAVKPIDDGDVFDAMRAGLGGLRHAWFKMAAAMVFMPPEEQPSAVEMEAALADEGLAVGDGELVVLSETETTPNRARRNQNLFGWPRAAWE